MVKRKLKNTGRIQWTKHAREKMYYYRISEKKVKKILKNPERIEEGIAPGTLAVMKRKKTKKPEEIWIMYQISKDKKKKLNRLKIISVWRYFGITKPQEVPLPEDVYQQLKKIV